MIEDITQHSIHQITGVEFKKNIVATLTVQFEDPAYLLFVLIYNGEENVHKARMPEWELSRENIINDKHYIFRNILWGVKNCIQWIDFSNLHKRSIRQSASNACQTPDRRL